MISHSTDPIKWYLKHQHHCKPKSTASLSNESIEQFWIQLFCYWKRVDSERNTGLMQYNMFYASKNDSLLQLLNLHCMRNALENGQHFTMYMYFVLQLSYLALVLLQTLTQRMFQEFILEQTTVVFTLFIRLLIS